MTICLVNYSDATQAGRAAFFESRPLYANPFMNEWAQAWVRGWRAGAEEFAAVCSRRPTRALLSKHRPSDIRPPRRRSRSSRTSTGKHGASGEPGGDGAGLVID